MSNSNGITQRARRHLTRRKKEDGTLHEMCYPSFDEIIDGQIISNEWNTRNMSPPECRPENPTIQDE